MPIFFLTISGFTNDQGVPENAAPPEFLAHSAEILGKVPIGGQPWLSKADRTSRHRSKRAVTASRCDPDHLIVLQEHKSEKLFFCERHRTMTFESPQPPHVIVVIPSTEAQEMALDYFQADLLNRGHSDLPCGGSTRFGAPTV